MNLYLHARLLCDIISNNILWLIVFISARKKCVEIALSLCKSLQVRSKIIHQILITQTFGCNALWNWWNVELMMRCRQSREVTPTKSVPMFALLFAVIEIYPELSIFFFWPKSYTYLLLWVYHISAGDTPKTSVVQLK